LVLNVSCKYMWIIFFTYLIGLDGLAVAKSYYCDGLSVAKTANSLSVLGYGAIDGPSLKIKFVAIYIQRRLQQ